MLTVSVNTVVRSRLFAACRLFGLGFLVAVEESTLNHLRIFPDLHLETRRLPFREVL